MWNDSVLLGDLLLACAGLGLLTAIYLGGRHWRLVLALVCGGLVFACAPWLVGALAAVGLILGGGWQLLVVLSAPQSTAMLVIAALGLALVGVLLS